VVTFPATSFGGGPLPLVAALPAGRMYRQVG